MRNTLTVKEYFLEQIFWIIVGYIWYRNIFFVNVRGLNRIQSHLVLFGVIVMVVAINYLFSGKWSLNSNSIIAATLIGYGTYTIIVWYKSMVKVLIVLGTVALFVSFMLIISIATVKINYEGIQQEKVRTIKKRLMYRSIRTVTAITSVAVIATLFGNAYIVDRKAEPKSVQPSKQNEIFDEKNSLAYNMDIMTGLDDEKWFSLNDTEKMDILQCMVNIEGRYLGFDKPISIRAEEMSDSMNGYYCDEDGEIVINVSLLNEKSIESTLTVAHECRHAAQHTLVRIYDSLDDRQKNCIYMWDLGAPTYKEEFENYIDGDESYYTYYAQKCEKDARNYSYGSTKEIYDRIEKYIATGELE